MDEEIRIHNMTREELDTAVAWATKEGWNPGLHDADVFWATDPEGFYTLEKDGEMIGSVSMVVYGGKFAFGGFFIVKPEYRTRGLGKNLVNSILENARQRLEVGAAIGGDGVFAMQPVYARWGFQFSHRDLRMESKAVKLDFSPNVQEIASADFEAIKKIDTQCFGFDREIFLKGWLTMPDSLALKYLDDSGVRGYGVVRQCQQGFKVGPLFTQNFQVAEDLFRGLSTFAAGSQIFLDIPEINQEGMKLAEKYQMQECFGCARMYLGPAPKLPYDQIFGITTFELG